ncbi:DoxX family protein [Enterococcus saccharolyticus]|uniref:DoxX family protein n=1 Tax=Enterococcus saccharolyticus TaxID=41997 RepID=UPI0039DFA48C
MDKTTRLTVSLVLVRVILGVSMLMHGISKVSDLAGTVGFFSSLDVPAFMAYLVILIEIVGGIFMIIGLLVPLVALGFVVVLATAMFLLGLNRGYVGGVELEVILIVLSIATGFAHFEKKLFTFLPNVK